MPGRERWVSCGSGSISNPWPTGPSSRPMPGRAPMPWPGCSRRPKAGPVAVALARWRRATTLFEVGRIGQLLMAAEAQDLAVLLTARRRFLAVLLPLYEGYFGKLGQWLVPPAGQAAQCWPALP